MNTVTKQNSPNALASLVSALGLHAPAPSKRKSMLAHLQNWFTLHPELAALDASKKSLDLIRQYMHLELSREEGARQHIMDRLYMRYSNLRRTAETGLMMEMFSDEEEDR